MDKTTMVIAIALFATLVIAVAVEVYWNCSITRKTRSR